MWINISKLKCKDIQTKKHFVKNAEYSNVCICTLTSNEKIDENNPLLGTLACRVVIVLRNQINGTITKPGTEQLYH